MSIKLRFAFCAASALVLTAGAAEAKRVIWVADNREASFGKGYYEQNPMPDDMICCEANGDTLEDAMAKLANGDKFIIVTHGTQGGGGIEIGGASVDGVKIKETEGGGTGGGCGDPVPLCKSDLGNIDVCLDVCFGASDPDGTGDKRSVADTFEDIFNDDESTVNGATDAVSVGWTLQFKNLDGATEQQQQAVFNCLLDAAEAAGFPRSSDGINQWLRSLDKAGLEQAENIVMNCPGGGDIELCFTFTQPTAGGGGGVGHGPSNPFGLIPDHIEGSCIEGCAAGACPPDLDGDGSVGSSDLALMLGAWGTCADPIFCPQDLDNSGDVGSSDLALLLGAWGPCP